MDRRYRVASPVEILLDDARRCAERLAAAGSAGEPRSWKGMVHVFSANLALLRAEREATDDIEAFLCRPTISNAPV